MLSVTGVVFAQNQAKEQEAVKAAESWIKLVDDANYAQSWTESADMLKGTITQQQLERSFKGVRESLGKIVTRKVKSIEYTTSLPGAVDGEYFIIQFESSFENKKTALEVVIPMLQKDSTWKVSGYYIR